MTLAERTLIAVIGLKRFAWLDGLESRAKDNSPERRYVRERDGTWPLHDLRDPAEDPTIDGGVTPP